MADDDVQLEQSGAWERANGEFLAASLRWLRAILRQRPADPSPRPVDGAAPLAVALRAGRTRRSVDAAPADQEPEGRGVADNGDVSAAAEAVRRAEAISPPPALVSLAATFGLSRFERDTLLLATAAELDPTIGRRFAEAQGNPAMTYPTLALALERPPRSAVEHRLAAADRCGSGDSSRSLSMPVNR